MTIKTISDETDTELLPCPFCGEPPQCWQNQNGRFSISCGNSQCEIEVAASDYWDQEHSAAAWNTRVGPAQAPAELSIDELGGWIEHGLCYGISSRDGRTAVGNLLAQFEIRPRASSAALSTVPSTNRETDEERRS